MSLIIEKNGTMIIDRDYEETQVQNLNRVIQEEEAEAKLEEIEEGE